MIFRADQLLLFNYRWDETKFHCLTATVWVRFLNYALYKIQIYQTSCMS